jgi:hypothetical protein
MDTALYFPYMHVPETSWFTHVLLYWDKAASIVPDDVAIASKTYMGQLMAAGLVVRVSPELALAKNPTKYAKRFLNLIDDNRLAVAPATSHWTSTPYLGPWERIHKSKVGESLFSELADRGLARYSSHADDSHYWELEQQTAGLYMAYVVGTICRLNHGYFPVTDSSSELASLVSMTSDFHSRLRELRYVTIANALPVPSQPVPPAHLASFKEMHHEELHRLRSYLNYRLADLAATDDAALRETKLEWTMQEISDDVARLRQQMLKRQWPKIILAGVGGILGSALLVGATIASPGAALAVGLGLAGGVLTLPSALYQAGDLLGARRVTTRAPLVYAALAQGL